MGLDTWACWPFETRSKPVWRRRLHALSGLDSTGSVRCSHRVDRFGSRGRVCVCGRWIGWGRWWRRPLLRTGCGVVVADGPVLLPGFLALAFFSGAWGPTLRTTRTAAACFVGARTPWPRAKRVGRRVGCPTPRVSTSSSTLSRDRSIDLAVDCSSSSRRRHAAGVGVVVRAGVAEGRTKLLSAWASRLRLDGTQAHTEAKGKLDDQHPTRQKEV